MRSLAATNDSFWIISELMNSNLKIIFRYIVDILERFGRTLPLSQLTSWCLSLEIISPPSASPWSYCQSTGWSDIREVKILLNICLLRIDIYLVVRINCKCSRISWSHNNEIHLIYLNWNTVCHLSWWKVTIFRSDRISSVYIVSNV